MAVAEQVFELLDPVIATAGAELYDVEWSGTVLRVLVTSDGGIDTATLAKLNRLVSPILDDADPIPGRYTLEVSSPGVERRLSRDSHYLGEIGEDVVVKTVAGHTPRRVKGSLRSFEAGSFTVAAVEVDGVDQKTPDDYSFSLDDVERTRTVFSWGPAPKPGGKKNTKPKNTKPKNN